MFSIPALLAIATTGASAIVNVLPQPVSIAGTGKPWLIDSVSIKVPESLKNESLELQEILKGYGVKAERGKTEIELRLDPAIDREEEYVLVSEPNRVTISARTDHGVFNGLQTFRQLISTVGGKAMVPTAKIDDFPRFAWRGFMLDDSRHFFSVSEIERLLDQLAKYKINIFHWHLSDDGGWRVEIKKYPDLTRLGAYRLPANRVYDTSLTTFPNPPSPEAYGGFYTQDQVRGIVAFAAAKHITIVPEFDMPGHCLAATSTEPFLLCTPSSQAGFKKEEGFQVPNILCPGKESTFQFVDDVLAEIMDLFPSKVIHIGGDEVDKYTWTHCDDCKQRMKTEGLSNPAQLESYFIARVEKYLNDHGRSIIGWDEIMEGGLAPNARVMSWRGTDGGIEAAKLGHEVVMTPYEFCYVNNSQSELTIPMMYTFDPVSGEIPSLFRKFVIGGEACLWTESVFDYNSLQAHVFPRLVVMAQNLWATRKEPYETFCQQLNKQMGRIAFENPDLYVSPPESSASLVRSGDVVTIDAPKAKGLTVHYTTNGLEPSLRSKVYVGPVQLSEGQVLTAKTFTPTQKSLESLRVVCKTLAPQVVPNPVPGLVCETFAGNFHAVPDFSKLTPADRKPMGRVVESEPDNEKSYSQRVTGYLHILRPGTYHLKIGSDDGSTVRLGGVKVIDNDGEHTYREMTTRVQLSAGNYPIEIGYFQGSGATKLRFWIGYELETPHEASAADLIHEKMSGE